METEAVPMAAGKHMVSLYIPSQCKCGNKIPDGIRSQAIKDVQDKFHEWFTASTEKENVKKESVKGGWTLPDETIAKEEVAIIYSYCTQQALETHQKDVNLLATKIANDLTQDGVLRVFDILDWAVYPNTLGSKLKLKHNCACHGKRISTTIKEVDPITSVGKFDSRSKLLVIQGILRSFGSIYHARKLFCEILGYHESSEEFVWDDWPLSIRSLLAEKPTILVNHNEFRIVYLRLNLDRLRQGAQRQIINRIFKDKPLFRGLFVISDQAQNTWELVNIKTQGKDIKQLILRSMRVGIDAIRTATEKFSTLHVMKHESSAEIQDRHDKAFDVETVTKSFFQHYSEVFYGVENSIKGFGSSKEDVEKRHLFTQQLFNRLLFIAFIQKKNWLSIDKSHDYLHALWLKYRLNRGKGDNFYQQRLCTLFFCGLNKQNRIDGPSTHNSGNLKSLIGTVPYLNGGLFEENDLDRIGGLTVPDAAIQAIIEDLFSHYNFTVSESTPADQEVAVDPEMLGTIFEELVTGRHEQGAYYTPKPIVQFMCHESLKQYLCTSDATLTRESIDKFIDHKDPSGLARPEKVLDLLRAIKVCDPACGSGAYLLGMLHELMDLRSCLFANNNIDSITAYERKLEIIQDNLYGVDLDVFALNITKLRLWLSLAVDFDGDNPPPLPNLDFKIEHGDSLTAPNPREADDLFRSAYIDLADKLFVLKTRVQKAHGSVQIDLLNQIAEKQHEMSALFKTSPAPNDAFDWRIGFAEVFKNGGFNVVVANPPYGLQVSTAACKECRYTVFNDSYAIFLQRSIEGILREGGHLSFIIPTSWQSGEQYSSVRNMIVSKSIIEYVANLPYDIFSSAYVDTCILGLTLKPRRPKDPIQYRAAHLQKNAKVTSPTDIRQEFKVVEISSDQLKGDFLIRVDPESGKIAKKIAVKAAFKIGDMFDSKRGIEAYKYKISDKAKTGWQKYYDGEVSRYMTGDYKYKYVQLEEISLRFHKGKRIGVRRIISRNNRLMASVFEEDFVVKKDIYCFIPKTGMKNGDIWTGLAVLNSTLLSYLIMDYSAAQKDDFRQVSLTVLRELPFPKLSISAKDRLALLGKQLFIKGLNDKKEHEIDDIVFQAFGLSKNEIKEIQDRVLQKG